MKKRSICIIAFVLCICCKVNAQTVCYYLHNDSVENVIIDSIASDVTIPQEERNGYKKAIEGAFGELWKDKKDKEKLPLDEVSTRNSNIKLREIQIDILNTLILKDSLENDTLALNHSVDSLNLELSNIEKEKLPEVQATTPKNEDADKIKPILLLKESLEYADSIKQIKLCDIDTVRIGYAFKNYNSFKNFIVEDSILMKESYNVICNYYPLASLVQQSVDYMGTSLFDKNQNRKFINNISLYINKNTLYSKDQISECKKIVKALRDMEMQTANLTSIVNYIWSNNSNGFASKEQLGNANIIHIIDAYVSACTDGGTEYNEYFTNLNNALRYLRHIFATDNYSSKIKNKAEMDATRSDIKRRFSL